MPQTFGHGLDVNARGQEQGGAGVAEIVEVEHGGQAGPRQDAFETAVHRVPFAIDAGYRIRTTGCPLPRDRPLALRDARGRVVATTPTPSWPAAAVPAPGRPSRRRPSPRRAIPAGPFPPARRSASPKRPSGPPAAATA